MTMKVWFYCIMKSYFRLVFFEEKKYPTKMWNFIQRNHNSFVQKVLLQNRIIIPLRDELLLYNGIMTQLCINNKKIMKLWFRYVKFHNKSIICLTMKKKNTWQHECKVGLGRVGWGEVEKDNLIIVFDLIWSRTILLGLVITPTNFRLDTKVVFS